MNEKQKQGQINTPVAKKFPEEQLLNEALQEQNKKSHRSSLQQQKAKDCVVLSREQKFEKLLESDVLDLSVLCFLFLYFCIVFLYHL